MLFPFSFSENKEHGSMEKIPKGILKETKSIDLEWFSGKAEIFPVPKSELQHDSNKTLIQDNHSQYQLVASKEPSRSQLFANHQGEGSGNVRMLYLITSFHSVEWMKFTGGMPAYFLFSSNVIGQILIPSWCLCYCTQFVVSEGNTSC